MNPLNVNRNNYHKNKKNSTILTPVGVSEFLFKILDRPEFHYIFDPCIGTGRLTAPWHASRHYVFGCDIKPNTQYADKLVKSSFEDLEWPDEWPEPQLVLCNPPFNGSQGRKLYPEVFLRRIFDLFGPKVPVVLFAPMGFRLNQRKKSKRWKWLREEAGSITSIISLPLDIFPDVEFHNEILIFNVPRLKAHYFLPEEAL